MSENAEKKENRKLCPFGWTHCAKEVCEWWLEFANSCAIPLTACILADSTICQNVIDTRTGERAKAYELVQEPWAEKTRGCDWPAFAVDEDGDVMLTDDCGNYDMVPEGRVEVRLKVCTNADRLLARAEAAEKERDAAVSDLETIMAYGGRYLDTCQFCKNNQCYARGGTKLCLPEWRGQKEG